jgi:hypothetical protein
MKLNVMGQHKKMFGKFNFSVSAVLYTHNKLYNFLLKTGYQKNYYITQIIDLINKYLQLVF